MLIFMDDFDNLMVGVHAGLGIRIVGLIIMIQFMRVSQYGSLDFWIDEAR
jgi:hypothetical protein